MYTPPVAFTDWVFRWVFLIVAKLKIKQTLALRGKRSRNKVSVGEPAEGSFIIYACSSWMFVLCWFSSKFTYSRFLQLLNNLNILNFQRWISRLLYRWRTQRNAIRNANCRIRESSDLWTQVAPILSACLFQCGRNHKSKCDWPLFTEGSLVKQVGLICENSQIRRANEVVSSNEISCALLNGGIKTLTELN